MEKHFTVSTYVFQKSKFLLLFHPKYRKWLPPGGHLEKDETPAQCALREVREETGLTIKLLPQENVWIDTPVARSTPRPYFCLLEQIPADNISPAHQHIDLIYLGHPIPPALRPRADRHLQWFTLSELAALEEVFSDTVIAARAIADQFF